jgi:hypothetical protein
VADGAWVPCYDSLWRSPKTSVLARELKKTPYHAGGLWLALLAWMRDVAENGNLGAVDRASLARALELATSGESEIRAAAKGEALYKALVAARFVDDRGYVSGWEDGPGRLIHERSRARERKRDERRRARASDAPQSVSKTDADRGVAEPSRVTESEREAPVTRDGDVTSQGRHAADNRDQTREKTDDDSQEFGVVVEFGTEVAEAVAALQEIAGYPFDNGLDRAALTDVLASNPDIDLVAEIGRWRERFSLGETHAPRQALVGWLRIASRAPRGSKDPYCREPGCGGRARGSLGVCVKHHPAAGVATLSSQSAEAIA